MTTLLQDKITVSGKIDRVLFSTINQSNIFRYAMKNVGFSFGFGAGGTNQNELTDKMGELLTVPGKSFYLPAQHDSKPTISTDNSDILLTPFNVKLENLDGESWNKPEFSSNCLQTGDLIEKWIKSSDPTGKFPLYGFVYTAKISKLEAAWVIKVPFEKTKPSNGKKIGDPENVKDYFRFVSENKDVSVLVVGVALDSQSPSLKSLNGLESLIFYNNPGDKGVAGRFKIHEHGILFREKRQQRVEIAADVANLIDRNNFLDVKHILDNCEVHGVSGAIKGYSGIEAVTE